MSLSSAELETRIWKLARERMAKRPKVLAEFSRRRWGRVLETLAISWGVLSFCGSMSVVAFMSADGQPFQNGAVPNLFCLAGAAVAYAGLLGAAIWRGMAVQSGGWWNFVAYQPISDQTFLRHTCQSGFVFMLLLVPSGVAFCCRILSQVGMPLGSAMTWGLILSLLLIGNGIATTCLFAVFLGRWLGSNGVVAMFATILGTLVIASVWPIQWVPGGFNFVARRLLWWPTGWPVAVLDALLQPNGKGVGWLIAANLVWIGLGLTAMERLIRGSSIREFGHNSLSQLVPLFDRPTIWGPSDAGTLQQETKSGESQSSSFSQSAGLDFVELEVSDEPLSAADARVEVLRGDFLRPISEDKLGWFERILWFCLIGRERSLATWLLIDGRFWTRSISVWLPIFWGTTLWFLLVSKMAQPGAGWAVMVFLILLSAAAAIATLFSTAWILLIGWPMLLWRNSANKTLPVLARLPVNYRELQRIRGRAVLGKLIVVALGVLPVVCGITWANNEPLWPTIRFVGKAVVVLLCLQTWWFLTWQPSGNIFKTVGFYFVSTLNMILFCAFSIMFLTLDDQIGWTAPALIVCGKVMSWYFERTLERSTFDLVGSTMAKQSRSFSLSSSRNDGFGR